MSKVIVVILSVLSALSIFIGVVRQKDYSEKYVQTKAILFYKEEKPRSVTKYMFRYTAGYKGYIAEKLDGFNLSERNIVYDKDSPSEYHFGYIDFLAKISFFLGILFGLLAVYVLTAHILCVIFGTKLLLFISLYSFVGLLFITEMLWLTLLIFFLTLSVIIECVHSSRNSEKY